MKKIIFLITAISAFAGYTYADQFFGGGGSSGSTTITASRAAVSDGSGNITAATTTATEIGYVNGVTSAIQTQLDAKAPLASPTFTGTLTTPATITFTSAGLNLGTSTNGGDGKVINVGNSVIRTADSSANNLTIKIPNGGSIAIEENNQQIATLSAQSMNWCAFAASRDCTFQWGMGKGTSHYGKGVALGYSSDTQVGNVTSGTDDLMSKSVQANALSSDGDRIEIDMWGTTGTGSTKTITASIGGTTAHTITTVADSATWNIECVYARTGASAGNYFCKSVIGTATDTSSGTLAVAHSGAIVVKGTGNSTDNTTDDVIQKWLSIKHMKVGN